MSKIVQEGLTFDDVLLIPVRLRRAAFGSETGYETDG